MLTDVDATIEAVYRSDWGRIVATLIRLFGDFDLAEETAQEAFAAALDQWRVSGIPESPAAWIIQTARHKAIDRIRRRTQFDEIVKSQVAAGSIPTAEEPDFDHNRDPRRSPAADLHLLPPCPRQRIPGRAHAPHAGWP